MLEPRAASCGTGVLTGKLLMPQMAISITCTFKQMVVTLLHALPILLYRRKKTALAAVRVEEFADTHHQKVDSSIDQ